MKQWKWFPLIISFLLIAPLLDACSFSVQVLSTTPTPPTFTPVSPTSIPTPMPPTTILPTPTLISIRAGMISQLEIFNNFKAKEIVRTLAFAPDGRTLAAAGGNDMDFSIYIWDIPNEQVIGTLSGHSNIIWSVAFSPDGRWLASGSKDKTVQIQDWHNGDILKTLNFPSDVANVSFSPDGQTLAAGGVDEMQNQLQNAAIWTYSTGAWQPLMKFPEYLNITAMALSPRGGILVGGGTSRNVQVWSMNDGKSLFTLNHAHQVLNVAISPDSSIVAAATCQTVVNTECIEGSVWLWDLSTGKLIRTLPGFPAAVEHVVFSPDGSILIAASRNGTLRFYGTIDYQPLGEFASPGGISALAISPEGGMLATGNTNGDVHLWKIVYRP